MITLRRLITIRDRPLNLEAVRWECGPIAAQFITTVDSSTLSHFISVTDPQDEKQKKENILSSSLPLCSHCQTFIWQFIFISPAPLIIGKGWVKVPFMFVLPHGHKKWRQQLCVCVCLVYFFLPPAFKLLITCLLSFYPSQMAKCMQLLSLFSCVCESSGLHQTVREEKGSAPLFTCQDRKGGEGEKKKSEIELMCCWFMWKRKTLGDTFDDSWKYIENKECGLHVDLEFSPLLLSLISEWKRCVFMAFEIKHDVTQETRKSILKFER